MKKFLTSILFFLIPFGIMFTNYLLFFHKTDGNLSRVGKIVFEEEYRDQFQSDFNKTKLFFELTPEDVLNNSNVDILTLGDSFSALQNFGYQNYLASLSDLKVYNMNREYYPDGNQIQMAFSMENGNLLQSMNVKYLIIQVVENRFVEKGQKIKKSHKINSDYFDVRMTTDSVINSSNLEILKDVLRFSFYNFFYKFDNRGFISPVYKMKLDRPMFTTRNKELLFYKDDIENLKYLQPGLIEQLNNELNVLAEKLKKKGIALIVLPAPDKYDLYQDYILDNPLPENKFFEMYDKLEKKYIYIKSKEILSSYLESGKKDVYFADDTHWSPFASKVIAKDISQKINIEH